MKSYKVTIAQTISLEVMAKDKCEAQEKALKRVSEIMHDLHRNLLGIIISCEESENPEKV